MSFIQSVLYAANGIIRTLKTEASLKRQTWVVMCVISAGAFLQINRTEWLLVLCCCMAIPALELLNTSIEQLCDVVSPEHHPVIGLVKDAAAGAVLWASIGALCIGLVIFLPKILSLCPIGFGH